MLHRVKESNRGYVEYREIYKQVVSEAQVVTGMTGRDAAGYGVGECASRYCGALLPGALSESIGWLGLFRRCIAESVMCQWSVELAFGTTLVQEPDHDFPLLGCWL